MNAHLWGIGANLSDSIEVMGLTALMVAPGGTRRFFRWLQPNFQELGLKLLAVLVIDKCCVALEGQEVVRTVFGVNQLLFPSCFKRPCSFGLVEHADVSFADGRRLLAALDIQELQLRGL